MAAFSFSKQTNTNGAFVLDSRKAPSFFANKAKTSLDAIRRIENRKTKATVK